MSEERQVLIDSCISTMNKYDKLRKLKSIHVNESLELELIQLLDLLIDWLTELEQPYTIAELHNSIEDNIKLHNIPEHYFDILFNTAVTLSNEKFKFEEFEYVIEHNLVRYNYHFEFFVILRTIIGAAVISKMSSLNYLNKHEAYFRELYKNLINNHANKEAREIE